MPDQEFLASFAVDIDEAGLIRLQEALRQNRALAEEAAAAFREAREAILSFFSDLSAAPASGDPGAGKAPESTASAAFAFAPDFTQANKDLAAFARSAKQALRLTADASGVLAAGSGALSALRSMFASAVLPLNLQPQLTSLGSLLPSLGASAAAGAANVQNKTVSAPISIQVTAPGTNPRAVGAAVYDVAEQYMLRTLQANA